MLDGIRVLEVSRPETMLAGQILAELGADVIVIEPPAGAPGRRMPPFLDDRAGLESSLAWHALNRNKRAITLDIEADDGRAIFEELLAGADVLLEPPSGEPPKTRERLVRCIVRPFSADGPKSRYAFTDRTVIAASGVPTYTGDTDREPLFLPVPQAMMEAGAEAAVAALAGLAARDRDGEGQRVEVSMRVAAMMSALATPYYPQTAEPRPQRGLRVKPVLGIRPPQFLPCADGFVQVSIAFGGFGAVTRRMAQWVVGQGQAEPEVAEVDWSTFPSGDTDTALRHLRGLIDGLTAAIAPLSKAQIGAAARDHGFFVAPLMDMADIAEFAQYAERGLWTGQRLPDGREIAAPARFAHFTPAFEPTRRAAPRLSEHTHEVLAEAGYSGSEVQALFCHHIV
ncbi:MAG: CoA transferase [Burkholderiaceae bacterium]|nr:CoA transferase [Burkholderiaceae bacterium]